MGIALLRIHACSWFLSPFLTTCVRLLIRCEDANLIDVPVRVSSNHGGVYHVAYFARFNIPAFEELTWDYGCSFQRPEVNAVDAVFPFHCKCGSTHCRDIVTEEPPILLVVDLLANSMK